MKVLIPQKCFIVDVKIRAKLDPNLVSPIGFGFIPSNPFLSEQVYELKMPHYNGSLSSQDFRYYEFVDKKEARFLARLFGDNYSGEILPIYTKIINTSFPDRDSFYAFPFRDNLIPSITVGGFNHDLMEEHFKIKEKLTRIATDISNGKKVDENEIISEIKSSEKTAYLNACYFDNSLYNFDLDKSWKTEEEKYLDPKHKEWARTPSRITVFEGWYSYAFWELYQKITTDMGISVCRNCGSFIDIKLGEHKDRFYCSQKENQNCWKERQRERKAKQRRKIR